MIYEAFTEESITLLLESPDVETLINTCININHTKMTNQYNSVNNHILGISLVVCATVGNVESNSAS